MSVYPSHQPNTFTTLLGPEIADYHEEYGVSKGIFARVNDLIINRPFAENGHLNWTHPEMVRTAAHVGSSAIASDIITAATAKKQSGEPELFDHSESSKYQIQLHDAGFFSV